MRMGWLVLLTVTSMIGSPGTPGASSREGVRSPGFDVDVIVDGVPLTEHAARGRHYVEALEGREYAIRLRNPLGVRVAVALSVDGLNTIDARRSSASGARKWVLGPHETVTISGWQTSSGQARRFYFTTEARSYGQWLGQTEDLGTISAVFFRESVPMTTSARPSDRDRAGSGNRREGQPARGPVAEAPVGAAADATAQRPAEKDAYAATGIGREVDHRVEQVWLDLDPTAVAVIDLRYEFRPQLVRLGVLPAERPTPLTRRERARGFDGPYSPVPR